jgi:uncharacterized protein YndB with AHSA1/START domain
MEAEIRFQGFSADHVFNVLGDPAQIPDWYLLAERVVLHEVAPGEEQTFDVFFAFFGQVFEEVVHWDPPHRYVYSASGPDFPIRDYIAQIEVEMRSEREGTMRWSTYCSEIEGAHNRRILPVMLPAINEASMQALAPLIGGVIVSVRNSPDAWPQP